MPHVAHWTDDPAPPAPHGAAHGPSAADGADEHQLALGVQAALPFLEAGAGQVQPPAAGHHVGLLPD